MSLEKSPGFKQVSVEGPVKFLRQELENEDVGLSFFRIAEGESHGAQNDPEKGHRHSEYTEIYYFQEGSGTFNIGDVSEKYEPGDAFMVKAFKYRRIDSEEDIEIFIEGAPIGD